MANSLKVGAVAAAVAAVTAAGVLYFTSGGTPDASTDAPESVAPFFQTDSFPRSFDNAFVPPEQNFVEVFVPAEQDFAAAFTSPQRNFGKSFASTTQRASKTQGASTTRAASPRTLRPFVTATSPQFISNPAELEKATVEIGKVRAGTALLAELRTDVPNRQTIQANAQTLGLQSSPEQIIGIRTSSAFFSARMLYTESVGYSTQGLPFTVLDFSPNPDLRALGDRLLLDRPSQVVVGFGRLNNFEQQDVTRYDDYMRDIRAVVRLVRMQSPDTFIWITACYGTPTYKPWMEQIGTLGDGIALWNVAYFPVVPRFQAIRRQVQRDARGKPVMLLGFFGRKPGSAGPNDFNQRMAAAEAAARQAGFAGFVRVDQ